jgi:hypothetical protein
MRARLITTNAWSRIRYTAWAPVYGPGWRYLSPARGQPAQAGAHPIGARA